MNTISKLKSIQEKFEQHKTLNPKLWTDDKTLKKEISDKLFNVIKTYLQDSQFLKAEDILSVEIVGSNASYNYNNKSDLDLHLIVDMAKLSNDKLFSQYANDGEKSIFNKKYDIELYGMSVEVYIQDINSVTQSNGIYDLLEDKWIKEPQKIVANIDENVYNNIYKEIEDKALNYLKSNNSEEINKFINNLYILRRQSLVQEGEAGNYNNIFKDLRAKGILKKLKDRVIELKNKQLSLKESNRMEFTESMKWIKKQTKNITDSDGFQTEYTWYYSPTEGTHIMIFGDSDLYTPNNTEPDWEGETDKEAKEWFDNYKGFEDESVYSVESLKEDWRDQMDDKDGHAQAYKSKAFAVNKAFADTIVNAMEEYIKEAQRGWITTEQVTKYGKMLGLDSIPYAKLSDIWQDIDNVASYYAFGTKDFNKSQKLLDASSAFLEIVNHYAREYRKNNPGRGKQAAMDAIDDIINNAANVTTDSEGVEYLSGTALRQIKEIAKKAGLTQSELEKHNKNFFGSMGYSIFESSKTTDIGKTYADIKIEKDFKAIGADNIKECRNRFESLLGKENNFIAYDEVMSGLIDNVSDEEIDRQIKNFNRYARLLKVTPENMIIYADAEMEQYPEEIALKVKQLNSDAILYKIPGTEIFFIEEMFPNAYSWLYFKTKKEAEVYFETAENN